MKSRLTFISWAPYCSRSDSIAARLGGTSHMVYSPRWGSRPATILFKYASQALQTLRILFRERPKAIVVMTPPVVAAFPVLLYARIFGASVLLDAHTAAFLGSSWSRVLFLHRWASRAASATLVTGDHLRSVVESWEARAEIVPDVPVCFAQPEPFDVGAGFAVAVVSSFNRDEPTRELIEAARALPDIRFFITGNPEKLDRSVKAALPDNVHLTGFLSDARYVGLLTACDAVVALTTRDHTMQRGAYEAIYLGKPVLTSDFPLLRESFPIGTVHVGGTAEEIAQGLGCLRAGIARLKGQAEELRSAKLRRWEQTAERLRSLAGLSPSVAETAAVAAPPYGPLPGEAH